MTERTNEQMNEWIEEWMNNTIDNNDINLIFTILKEKRSYVARS